MFTDDQNRNSSGQSGFVRRSMPNTRFDGDKTAPPHQNNSDYPAAQPSYGTGGGYNSQPRPQYNPQQRRHGSEGFSGGYNSRSSSSYGANRTGGYQRNAAPRDSGGAAPDRLIKQNDQIIKLLREIRDRLPPPAAGTPQYDSAPQEPPYKAEPSRQAAEDAGSDGAFDVSGAVSAPAPASANADDEDGKFNS